MRKSIGLAAAWHVRGALLLLALFQSVCAHAWSATRLPEVTLKGSSDSYARADLNRDGRLDIISTGTLGTRGFVEVRYAKQGGFKQQADFRYEGPMDWAMVGYSPMAMDVNGDGWPDLIVGAYAYSGRIQYAGAVLVFFGGPNGFPAQPSQVIEGPESGSYFGFTIRPLGDFNHDGYADLAVSAEVGGQGKIYVYTGSPTGLVARPSSTLQAPLPLDWATYGRAFDTGDTNGDGIFDIVVAASGVDGQGRPSQVFVYRGTQNGYTAVPSETINAPDDITLLDVYGAAVTVLGDLDGDGYNDLAVGAPELACRMSEDLTSSGRVFVYYGSAQGYVASKRMQVLQPAPAEGFPCFGDVMLGRDFNGDGYGDLIVGSTSRAKGPFATPFSFPGALWIYTGGHGGLTKAPYKRRGAIGSNDGLGNNPEAADVTGDGQMDIISAGEPGLQIYRGLRGLK